MTIDKINSQLINNPITYRPILTIPKHINFGIELELESVDFNGLEKRIKSSMDIMCSCFGAFSLIIPSLSKNITLFRINHPTSRC